MAKVTIRDILSPKLRKKLDELNAVFEEKLAKAISDKGLLEGQYERLVMDCKVKYNPREKGKYPTSSRSIGAVLIIWKMRRLWACYAPISNMNIGELEPVTGVSREDAIIKFMDKYIIYNMRNSVKERQDFNKWNNKYGKRKKGSKDAI